MRPAPDSPLVEGGAGKEDLSLPQYVGAVPPEGVEPWDWQHTWNVRRKQTADAPSSPDKEKKK
jgi:hypothetical protein